MDISGAHPDLVRVLEQYKQLCAGRPMPLRSEFFPTQFRWMLGRMFLLDVLDGGKDYRYRLFGDFWEIVYGVDLSGRTLSSLEAEGRLTSVRTCYDKIVAGKVPRYHPGTVRWPGGESFEYERLLLPFADTGGIVSLIVGAATCKISGDDLRFFRGLGFPELVLDSHHDAADVK